MKIITWGLVAFNIAAIFEITRTASFFLTVIFILSLILADILLVYVFRSFPIFAVEAPGGIATSLRWNDWTCYIPVLGGIVCLTIGVFELAWKLCLLGSIAIAIGIWRLWCHRQFRQTVAHQNELRQRE